MSTDQLKQQYLKNQNKSAAIDLKTSEIVFANSKLVELEEKIEESGIKNVSILFINPANLSIAPYAYN